MPATSLYPTIAVPDVDIWTLLFEQSSKPFPNHKVVYVDADTKRSYTCADVRRTAIDFGTGLKDQWDWKKDDVLALYTINSIDTPSVMLGTHWAGGIVTPANPGYTVDELAFQLKDAGARALATQFPLLSVAKAAADKAGVPHDRIILIGDERDPDNIFKHYTDFRASQSINRHRRTKIKNPKKDLAFLVYSSGTTGHPKGVMLSHTNIVANVLMIRAVESRNFSGEGGLDGKGDKVLAFLPFFHIYGLTMMLHVLFYDRIEVVVLPKFTLERWMSVVQEHCITYSFVVPPVVLGLVKSPNVSKYDLSSLRMLNSAAAPLSKDLTLALYERLKIPVKQAYGLSETSPATHTQEWEDWQTAMGSVGKLLPNQVAKYVDAEGKEVPIGEIGELWIKGPNVFLGYLNNPAGTKDVLTDDGYFKTGDVGYQDAQGNFYITDRIKELIKYKGFQVAPAELEGLLGSHPLINDVAVLGIYSQELATEVPRAYIVPNKGVESSIETEKKIHGWLNSRIANHKKLRGGIRFIDEVPKSASGKILRRVLREKAKNEAKEEIKSRL